MDPHGRHLLGTAGILLITPDHPVADEHKPIAARRPRSLRTADPPASPAGPERSGDTESFLALGNFTLDPAGSPSASNTMSGVGAPVIGDQYLL
jgi:hypothetical protein